MNCSNSHCAVAIARQRHRGRRASNSNTSEFTRCLINSNKRQRRFVHVHRKIFLLFPIAFILILPLCAAHADAGANIFPCEKEEDLESESCSLRDLPDAALISICDRIGLDVASHVLPYLLEEDEENSPTGNNNTGEGRDATSIESEYTHENYVRAAEECLLIEDEMDRLSREDPQLMEQLEREALEEDPEMMAEVLADVLRQDPELMAELMDKLVKDAPDVLEEMRAVMDAEDDYESVDEDFGEGGASEGGGGGTRRLEDRPDLVGYFVANMLSENPHLLDEFDTSVMDSFLIDDDQLLEFEEEGDDSGNYIDVGGEL